MLHKLIKDLAPVAALALGAFVAGCDNMHVNIGDDGVPLAELDMTGDPPTELVLAGPDRVVVQDGSALDIDVSGDDGAVKALRLSLDDGALNIGREDSWKGKGVATVRVTMPTPRAITLAGSGDIEAASLAGDDGSVTIAGSGTARIARVASPKLDVTVAGSGSLQAAGRTDTLDLNIVGSGSANMAGLRAESADITIAGSGNAEFDSDGKVKADIMGSGTVTVSGRADCTVDAMGSGTLKCRAVSSAGAGDQ